MPGTRIYADFNGIDRPAVANGCLAVALDTMGSVQDLSNAGLRLTEGLRLTIWDASDEAEDLEADATARYDAAADIWWADLGDGGYRYVPAKNRDADPRFLCLVCRADIASQGTARGAVVTAGKVCPHCGTPMSAAIAPPAA